MISTKLFDNNDYEYMAQRQKQLERDARRLASAWSDFDTVEQLATEVVRRFSVTEPRDLGVLRLHKEPVFVALQTACVIGYTRPFMAGLDRFDAKYTLYTKPEWQGLHEELFVWKERLSGDGNLAFRQYVVAPDIESKQRSDRFVIGEATPVLSPLTEFAWLKEMCTDRKAMLWPELQSALAQCYPVLHHPVLLSLSTNAGASY